MSEGKLRRRAKVTPIASAHGTPNSNNSQHHPSTGPLTPEGKRIASRNATLHGCTASLPIANGHFTPGAEARLVLPDEDPADWEALKENWKNEYQPANTLALTLVLRAAVSDWMMRRTARRYHEVEQQLFTEQPDSTFWTVEQHSKLELFLRYQARAERSFYRARNAVEQIRREKKKDAERAANASSPPSAQRHATQPGTTNLHPRPFNAGGTGGSSAQNDSGLSPAVVEQLLPKTTGSLIQCVTVQVLNGNTLTIFQPRNENLARIIISAGEPKPLVKRALYFLHGIPPEYAWITDYETHDGRPHFVITRTSDEALGDFEREQLEKSGHLLEPK